MAEQMKPSGIDWIGDIPESWKVTRLQTLFDQVKDKNSGTKEKNLLSLSYGKIVKKDIEGAFGLIPESFDTYNIIKKNDIVLRLTDMQNDQVSLRTGLVKEEKGIITSAYVTIRLRFGSPSYYHWYLYAFDTSKQIYAFGQGVRQSLTFEELKKMLILLPSPKEQQAIADFLDEECAQIDSIATDLEKQIALLQQYKKSLITETVTKGLDKSVPMKDSGVEWIGKIPDHWDAKRMKYFLSVSSGDAITNEQLEDGEYPVYGGGKQMGYFNRTNVDKNKILIGRVGANCGCVTITDVPSWATDNALVVQTYCHFKYIYYLLISADLNRLNEANAQPLITGAKVGNCVVSFTKNYAEQEEIARYLDEHCEKIENIIVGKQEQLETIRQHKKSLIYEYVTGKKRVKEVQ